MDIADLIDHKLIRINLICKSIDDLFEQLCATLYENGYIEDTFKVAIAKREKEFPTGLVTESLKFAIPHTDPMHVKKPFIFVVKLAQSLQFVHMGTTDQVIEVDNIFMLGIEEPSQQVNLLSSLLEKIQDVVFKNEFQSILDTEVMETYLKNTFRSVEK